MRDFIHLLFRLPLNAERLRELDGVQLRQELGRVPEDTPDVHDTATLLAIPAQGKVSTHVLDRSAGR